MTKVPFPGEAGSSDRRNSGSLGHGEADVWGCLKTEACPYSLQGAMLCLVVQMPPTSQPVPRPETTLFHRL